MRLMYALDLSNLSSNVDSKQYKRMRKTHIKVLSSQVPESFVEKFQDEEIALSELLDAVYGMMDHDEDDFQ